MKRYLILPAVICLCLQLTGCNIVRPNARLQAENNQLEEQNGDLRLEKKILQTQLNIAYKEQADLRKLLEARCGPAGMADSIVDMQKQMESWKGKALSLQDENQKLKAELVAVRRENMRLQYLAQKNADPDKDYRNLSQLMGRK